MRHHMFSVGMAVLFSRCLICSPVPQSDPFCFHRYAKPVSYTRKKFVRHSVKDLWTHVTLDFVKG